MPSCTATIAQAASPAAPAGGATAAARRDSGAAAAGRRSRQFAAAADAGHVVRHRHGSRSAQAALVAAAGWRQQVEAAFLHRDESRRGARRAARGRGRSTGDRLDDAAGPRRHHVDLVGEEDRLLDVMGDEDNGLAEIGPQLQQPFLHAAAWSARRARRTARRAG